MLQCNMETGILRETPNKALGDIVTTHSDVDWAEHARNWQQDLGHHWSQALQTLQNGTGGMGALRFQPDKLLELQQAYLREASELWNQGLADKAPPKDKRFGHDAWARN